jgi:hypothetical protein
MERTFKGMRLWPYATGVGQQERKTFGESELSITSNLVLVCNGWLKKAPGIVPVALIAFGEKSKRVRRSKSYKCKYSKNKCDP